MIQFNTFSQTRPLFDYLKKRRQNQKFVQTVELAASFFLVSFFLLFAIKPTVFTISSLLGDIKSKEILSQKQLKPKINQIIQAQDAFVQIQQDYHLIKSSFPDTPSYYHTAVQVRGASQQVQLPLNRISFAFSENQPQKLPVQNYTFTLNQKTRFDQITAFVNLMTENRRLIDIRKISLSKDSSATEGNQINFNLSAEVLFWQQDNEKK